jgi:hypothetical protein
MQINYILPDVIHTILTEMAFVTQNSFTKKKYINKVFWPFKRKMLTFA